MSWFVDNANIVYILLGLAALGFAAAGWITRRVKFFAIALVPVLLIALFWLLTQFVATDRQQIQTHVVDMANAVVAGDAPGLFKHVARDFNYKGMTREQLAKLLTATAAMHKITEVKIWEFEVVELSRAKRSAKTHFKATVFDREATLAVVFCIGDFVLEDEQWKLKTIDFRNAANPDQPMPGAP